MYDLIITGSEGLIGKYIVNKFNEMGYDIAKLDLNLGHDLTDKKFVSNWFEKNKSKVLINLFAIDDKVDNNPKNQTFKEIEIEEFEHILKVNVSALFNVCKNYLINNDKAKILNFSSIYGMVSPIPHLYGIGEKNIAYGVSKSAVIQLTKHLAVHAGPDYRINCIVLGGILHNQNSEFINNYSSIAPIKRMGSLEEVFQVVNFLVSDVPSYMTGSSIIVDGGWTAI